MKMTVVTINYISIHALLAESDICCKFFNRCNVQFLSTLSLRRATQTAYFFWAGGIISIHALLAESDVHYDNYNLHCVISIHALLAESDSSHFMPISGTLHFYPRSPCGERRLELFLYYQDNRFLSTLSLRRATVRGCLFCVRLQISIHALLAESDYDTSSLMQCQAKFLSTLSLRRATLIL